MTSHDVTSDVTGLIGDATNHHVMFTLHMAGPDARMEVRGGPVRWRHWRLSLGTVGHSGPG